MTRVLLLIHLSAVIVWIGGIFFVHFCLRPVAAAQLPPPQRLPLLAAVLGRFFGIVTGTLVLLWGSGLARFAQVGGGAPAHWTAMAAIGAVMTAIFALIVLRYHRRMVAAVAGQDWPAAGRAMDMIRQLALANLLLGFITVAVAVLGW